MESGPKNHEFRNNPENSPMHSASSESHNETNLTVNSEFFARILFSRTAVKDIFAK